MQPDEKREGILVALAAGGVIALAAQWRLRHPMLESREPYSPRSE